MMSSPRASLKLVAVAVDKDKGSQAALKWAIETICQKGQKLLLIHVKVRPQGTTIAPQPKLNEISKHHNAFDKLDAETRDLLLPFRVLCSRKDIHSQEIVLEDVDIARALIEFVKLSAIEVCVLGATAKSMFRFKLKDTPGSVLRGAPDFCSVYVISKGKISTSKPASRSAPRINSFRNQILHPSNSRSSVSQTSVSSTSSRGSPRTPFETPPRYGQTPTKFGESTPMRSPFTHRKGANGKPHEYLPAPESDISFVSSAKPCAENLFPSFTDSFEDDSQRLSGLSELDSMSVEPTNLVHKSVYPSTHSDISSYYSAENDSSTSQNGDEDDSEMQRLKQELKKTMEMYGVACKEALTAKQKALELQNWKMEEQRKLEETRQSEESAQTNVEQERTKPRAATEHAEAAWRIAELDSRRRVDSEMKALLEVEENKFSTSNLGYRRYTIEEIEEATDYFSQSRKIGEGGYGPVYKCHLDHTPVAVKVLRPDAAQGRSQFQQEVQVLSCIRHPNMVLLLGACPEYGCLVYEYMPYGSLDDCLMQHGKNPPLPWQHRFRIAAEITTGLLFLHHSKPEPIVHRDLKPGNILLDRNLVSKISDVGLARLVPPSVADTMTQYRMTSTAGTFCYIDPEYQQTGMLGVKSDVYSLGIIFLQILTSRPPMGLTHQMLRAIESGAFAQILDPAIPDWPVEDALLLAKLGLQCSELRRKDRPDLGKVVMPVLERLRAVSEER
ncbi:hypothetical protein Leryth_021648 [Lithospermum erythrorhizon]|uniref:Protein kinase domain-containing protein n=1 Tax=Lithospermum erythrorhizon TaxID=34254 RepID=A0AAV3RED9_LITER|nr:hypothetical protein Leryth_021648 [Lithospermum erythrorhizon]